MIGNFVTRNFSFYLTQIKKMTIAINADRDESINILEKLVDCSSGQFNFRNIMLEEVYDTIIFSKNKHTVGDDEITNNRLKQIPEDMAKIVKSIFNSNT